MIYFAYGSNMSVSRLRERVPSASACGTGFLFGHTLAFHKVGRKDGSGKCDAFQTENAEEYVIGALYSIAREHKSLLDKAEGSGIGYETKEVTIKTLSNEEIAAFTYCATHIDSALKPFHWYKHHVLYGARENGLPADYIENILSVESVKDPCPVREAMELSIYPHQ